MTLATVARIIIALALIILPLNCLAMIAKPSLWQGFILSLNIWYLAVLVPIVKTKGSKP